MTGTLIAYVDDMFVHPSYRGQKIATTLFHEMEQKAKELGATRIDLMVWEFNESAQELYRSLGMTPQRYILEKITVIRSKSLLIQKLYRLIYFGKINLTFPLEYSHRYTIFKSIDNRKFFIFQIIHYNFFSYPGR